MMGVVSIRSQKVSKKFGVYVMLECSLDGKYCIINLCIVDYEVGTATMNNQSPLTALNFHG